MKITKLSQEGAYSIGRYWYFDIKTSMQQGVILLLPESFIGNTDSKKGCLEGIYNRNGQKFTENSVYLELESMEHAKKVFCELGVSVAVVKDVTQKEIYILDSV